MGDPEPVAKQGLLMRLLYNLFEEVKTREDRGVQVTCKVQMVEVYNEELNDLLRLPGQVSQKKVSISVTPKFGAQVVGATETLAANFKDCLKFKG